MEKHLLSESEPKLDRPGAGLPIPLRWIARWMVPWRAKRTPWQESVARFERNSKKIEEISKTLSETQLNQRVLVAPIAGLEDSSRYWSAGMVLEHLMLAGRAFHQIIEQLSNGTVPPIEVRVEKVKPPVHQRHQQVVQDFQQFWTQFFPSLKLGPKHDQPRLLHPWFGPLNAHQWVYVLSVHHSVHLKQLRNIVDGLPSLKP
jgi:hypothetical protein